MGWIEKIQTFSFLASFNNYFSTHFFDSYCTLTKIIFWKYSLIRNRDSFFLLSETKLINSTDSNAIHGCIPKSFICICICLLHAHPNLLLLLLLEILLLLLLLFLF